MRGNFTIEYGIVLGSDFQIFKDTFQWGHALYLQTDSIDVEVV